MTVFSYELAPPTSATIGMVVLQADETIERDLRQLFGPEVGFLVSRVPSGLTVTLDTLGAMEARLTEAASLLPRGRAYDAIGYGCTSGAAQIGVATVADRIRAGADAKAVTDPVSALLSACEALGLRRLALLSPYVEPVSERLRAVLSEHGIETPVFGSFAEPTERAVARISPGSVFDAGKALAAGQDVDGVFLSCTNLRTVEIIDALESTLGVPVLSSNLVLAWRLLTLAGATPSAAAPGRLFGRLRAAV